MGEYRMFGLRRRVQYTLLAGLAGAFLIPQVSFAAPTGEQNLVGSAAVSRAGATTNIGSSTANNVISWADYSIGTGETVNYDAQNYLNLVRGGNTSAINGTLSGGGNIYLVNPNGVIIGKGATVHVGSLHVSTQEISTVNQNADMAGDVSPFSASAAGKADVVNMGAINATSVEVVGRSIRFLNDANVTVTSSPVVLRTDTANDGTAHIGYRGTAPATTKYQVNGGLATAGDNYYQLVANATELQNINNNLSGNYMLEDNIDFNGGALTPIGGNGALAAFSGKVDGNFYQVKNFTVTGVDHAGLFGKMSGARIENLGVVNPSITGNDTGAGINTAGGIVGHASGNTKLRNVYVEGGSVTGEHSRFGGIVGYTTNTKIDGSYNTSPIETGGGGIIGSSDVGTEVTNTYNRPSSQVTGASYFIRFIDPANGTTVKNSFTTSTKFSTTTSFTSTNVSGNYFIDFNTRKAKVVMPGVNPPAIDADAYSSSTYNNWSINNNGDPGAKWRIYEGRTAPLLTAFMSGTATATYSYRYFNNNSTAPDKIDGVNNTVKSNNGKDLTGLTYNSKYLRIVDADAPNTPGDKSKIQYEPSVNLNKVEEYTYTGTSADKTQGIRNAGTKAIVWSDQHGPNLRGVNVTIGKRKVSLDPNDMGVLTRVYNGKTDVKDTFAEAVRRGGKSGFTADDVNEGSVTLNMNSFTARMVDKNVLYDTNGNPAAKNVTFGGSITFDGTDEGNYTFDNSSLATLTGKITITPAPLYLTIHKKTAANKIYDGTDEVKDADMRQSKPNIELNKTIAAGTTGEIMKDDGGTQDTVDLAATDDPTYTDDAGNQQIHAGTHKLRYKNVGLRTDGAYANDAGNYELFYRDAQSTEKKVTGGNVYLDGKIVPREIKTDGFKVYKKSDNTEASAQKVYDGNNEYTLDTTNLYLSANAGATTDTTGIVSRDKGHITFALTGGKGQFRKSDGTTSTKNVQSAAKIAYNVTGQSDNPTEYQLGDYYVKMNSVDTPISNTFNALGAGKITPKTISATKKNDPITKVYDALEQHTDGNRNPITGDTLVTLSGVVSGDTITNTTTATYASKNVVYSGGVPATQNVTYNVAFSTANADEADNYTFDTTPNTTTVTRTTTLTGLGTITPRPVTLTFGPATKIYDGTATNTQTTLSTMSDGTTGNAVLGADGYSTGNVNLNGVTSRFGDGSTEATFRANKNAGSRTVEYAGINNALGGNYTLGRKQYGTGTITRRRIDPSGFQVLDEHGHTANATKVYDGTADYSLPGRASLVTPQASGPNEGIVSRDFGKITFRLKNGTKGKFTSDSDGNNATSHVSEAQYIAYDIVAQTSDATNNPLTNYTFGSSGSPRDLETVTDNDPAHATAAGSITPAALKAVTKEISKVYDGLTAHTDGNRNVKKGDSIVDFTGWVSSSDKRENTSTAEYADKNVSRDASKKGVTYTAQLKGQYADDYQIVNDANTVISTSTGMGASKTVTANLGLQANKGTITPRKLKITMDEVTKTYDGTVTNERSTISRITDEPSSSVIDQILAGDSITKESLNTKWQAIRSAGDAGSSYGHITSGTFRGDANASNGTKHDVRYTNMGTAFRNQFSAAEGNYTVDEDAFGKGTITRKAIAPDNFKIVDRQGNVTNATKVYDGTSDYAVPEGWRLTPSTGGGTGVIAQDADKIRFGIDKTKGAHFTTTAGTETPNVADATRVAYNIKATTDAGDEYLLKNYTLNGKNLESGEATASGAGSITRRKLTVGLVQDTNIDKVYDGTKNLVNTQSRHWNALTEGDARGNVAYERDAKAENKLVRTDGSHFDISSSYADKNVRRDSSDNGVSQNITYNIKIAGGNYTLSDGNTTVDAEVGLTLRATGKIMPKDLSGSFKEITKIYDGTKNVDPSKVAFKNGAVVDRDNVRLGSHTEAFQSENVRGDGTTANIDGTPRRNWINYSNLTLGGADAGNYTISKTAKGLGTINPYELNHGTVKFGIDRASKTYDGNKSVWKGTSNQLSDVKGYIRSATVEINGHDVSVLGDLNLTSAEYDSKDVNGGWYENRVKYNFSFTGTSGNFSLGGAQTLEKLGDGEIKRKDVTATVRGALTKTYDATKDVLNVAKDANRKTVASGDDLVRLEGLVNDGAQNNTTAVYDNKNAGTGKNVTYNIGIDGAHAANYRVVDAAKNEITAPVTTGGNTITKRKVDLTFADVQKKYDTTATNTSVTASVSAADAAVLNRDRPGFAAGNNKLTGLTGITSEYGTGTGDAFVADPNAGRKTVRYQGTAAAMNSLLAGDAGNYEFTDPGFGAGDITRIRINQSDFTFNIDPAVKEYDGTKNVVWTDPVTKKTYGAEKYFRSSTFKLNGVDTPVNPDDIKLNKAEYDDLNAAKARNVDYEFTLNDRNFDIVGGSVLKRRTSGRITPRDLTTKLPQHIVKEYDGKDTLTHESHEYVEGVARDNLTTIVERDKGKISLDVKGKYRSKDATVDTRAEAEARTAGGIGVDYELTLTGDDADRLANYTIGGHPTKGTATGTADIYRKTLTVDVTARKDKDYDGTAATLGLSAGDVTITGGFVAGESFTLDQGAVNQIHGEYLDTNGNADANVSRDAAGNVVDKGISYRGFNNAFKDLALRNPYAKNYVVADDRRTYSADEHKGRINPLGINADNMKFTFKDATKIYDGTTAVKHGESAAPADVKKYLDSAKIKIGGNDVTIDNRYFNIDAAGTHYDNKNVQGGAKHDVTYAMTYTGGGNFTVKEGAALTGKGAGYITRKGITAQANGALTKVYDATTGVYDAGDTSIKTYLKSDTNRRSPVTKGDSLVTLKGLVDDAVNETTAEYDSKYVGTDRRVTYRLGLDAAHADNYEFVDENGNALARNEISTDNNEITRRTLNISFGKVGKTYDTTADNKDVRAFVDADDAKVLARDGMTVADGRLTQLDGSNIRSLYGKRDRAKDTFTPNPNAGEKDVRYADINRTVRSKLSAGAQDNYEIADVGYGTGTIEKAMVSHGDFNFRFDRAVKEYDGTADVKDAKKYLRTDGTQPNHSTVRLKGADGVVREYALPEADVESMTGVYTGGVDASTANNPVQYGIDLNVNNYSFSDGVGRYRDAGTVGEGLINRRRIVADTSKLAPTKTYDGNNRIVGAARDAEGNLIRNTDGLVHFKQYGTGDAGIVDRDKNGEHIMNRTEAAYVDKNVAWEDYAAGKVQNKAVDYKFILSGERERLDNYELVDEGGNAIGTRNLVGTELTHETRGEGRINPVDITLKAEEKTIWINDGLPKPEDYKGTPMGRGYETGVGGEALPGTISYDSPNARLRWGDYAINGTYTPAVGDTVYRNYRFRQAPGNATALHVGPYIPDANYYNIMAQNKMIPDEYAYENASLDRRSNFGRRAEAAVEYTDPALNSMQDGKNVRTPDIYATDDAVFALMDQVFG
ncbi:filamentous hemagglutinin family N-terminal domain protein [Selenomonas sp. FOBRC9]|uniref:YDG domain-containing protein n=1 Tax=Selenomonas sp. FOBRC9 TaxID=936573 RepID=UPI00027A5462|nr:filamentous hemagglutinin family N-terminal domain protein [Selenomonas sp. FOBRC9]